MAEMNTHSFLTSGIRPLLTQYVLADLEGRLGLPEVEEDPLCGVALFAAHQVGRGLDGWKKK